MRAGIYAAYNRGEQTACAVRLAGLLTRQGWDVFWLAPTINPMPVHPYWDRQVRLATPERLSHWGQRCDSRIWFHCDPDAVHTAYTSKDKGDMLVPSWHELQKGHLPRLPMLYDVVLCPWEAMLAVISREAGGGLHGTTLKLCQWSGGLSEIRTRFSDSGHTLLYADSHSCRTHIDEIVRTARVYLSGRPDNPPLRISLDAPMTATIRDALYRIRPGNGPKLLGITFQDSLDVLTTKLQRSKLLLYFPVRCTAGLMLQQAAEIGVPSAAWYMPTTKMLATSCAPCKHTVGPAGARTATEFDAVELVEAGNEALHGPHEAVALSTENSFRDFWTAYCEPAVA